MSHLSRSHKSQKVDLLRFRRADHFDPHPGGVEKFPFRIVYFEKITLGLQVIKFKFCYYISIF